MKSHAILILMVTALLVVLPSCGTRDEVSAKSSTEPPSKVAAKSASHAMPESKLPLGSFSISLAVQDIAKSRAFYEKLGFESVLGKAEQNWLILQNGTTTIGLFQGMFEENIMTFNPGWTSKQETIPGFTDVREIQRRLKDSGLKLLSEADESTSGPASLTLKDPDGNTILIDQHVK